MMNHLIKKYPYYKRNNSNLYNVVKGNIISEQKVEGTLQGRRTDNDFHNKGIDVVDSLMLWIGNTACENMHAFATKKGEDLCYGQFYRILQLIDCWGTITNKGEWLSEHSHFPYTISFVYGVKMPKGSSSIIINNKRVKYEEGDCVFFPSWLYHKVNRNNVNDRCSIAGNFLYSVDKPYT